MAPGQALSHVHTRGAMQVAVVGDAWGQSLAGISEMRRACSQMCAEAVGRFSLARRVSGQLCSKPVVATRHS